MRFATQVFSFIRWTVDHSDKEIYLLSDSTYESESEKNDLEWQLPTDESDSENSADLSSLEDESDLEIEELAPDDPSEVPPSMMQAPEKHKYYSPFN